MANEWNGEYYELCRDCHDYPCRCIGDQPDAEDDLPEPPSLNDQELTA